MPQVQREDLDCRMEELGYRYSSDATQLTCPHARVLGRCQIDDCGTEPTTTFHFRTR